MYYLIHFTKVFVYFLLISIPYLLHSQKRDSSILDNIIITNQKEQKSQQVLMGVEKINAKLVNKLSFFFGERDMMSVTALMPGVKSESGGQGSISIRGGGYDQNLVLLDGATIYNPAHLLGAFSVFHSDAIKNVTLYKGTAPARYGGRISGVIEAESREGNNTSYIAKGGLGIITSRLSIEGPIQKGKSSFFLSGRRTYADFVAKTFSKKIRGNELYFYDGNAQINFHFNEKNTLSFIGYYGQDRLNLKDLFSINWSNLVGLSHYQHIFSYNSVFNTYLSFNQYKVNLNLDRTRTQSKPLEISFLSRINEFTFRSEWEKVIYQHKILVGMSGLYRNNIPGNVFFDGVALSNLRRNMAEIAIYAQDNWQIIPKLNLQYGLRLQSYLIIGGNNDFYILDKDRNYIRTVKMNGIVKQFISPEPRIALKYSFKPNHSFKIAYNRNSQGVFLINNSLASLPTDRWIIASNNVPISTSNIGVIGYASNIHEWEFSTEAYYKFINNIVDYKDGANANDPIIDQQLLIGKGRTYGIEFLIRKHRGLFSGWIAYTLARAEQKTPGVNNNQYYISRQDRLHDFNIVFITTPNPRLTIALLWTYQTGRAVSLPSAKYKLIDRTVFLYKARNSGRMPPNHHLDFSLSYKLKHYKHLQSELAFSIFNVYARENPFIIQIKEDPEMPNKVNIIQTSLFSIIPSISWNFTIF